MKRLLFLLIACGSSGTSDSPLVGSWFYDASNEVYTFKADKSLEIVATNTDMNSGCTNTEDVSASWSTSGNSLTTTVESGTVTITGCNDSSMNAPSHPDTGLVTGPHNFTYSISGNALTLTNSMGATSYLIRQ